MSKSVNSAVVIAELLNAEGFTPHIASKCESFAKRKVLTERQKASYIRTDEEFNEIVKALDQGQRHIIGKFINFQKAFAFHGGLRVGLGAFNTDFAFDVEVEEPPTKSA